MGKERAKRILFHVEELATKQQTGQFASTVREGDRTFILQLGFNAHGTFLLFFELDKGRWRGSIVILEGNLGSGWRRFGVHLRKILFPVSQNLGAQFRRTTIKPVGVLENFRQIPEGGVYKGKEMMSGFQNLNLDFSWRRNFGIVKDSDGEVVTSVIKGAVCSSGIISPTLDISLRVERGIDGQWQVVPGLGSSTAPSVLGLPQILPSKLPVLLPLNNQKMGSSLPTSDEVGLGSEEGIF
nr:hypothetical protein CFP56_35471 [Quercus suber]